MERPPNALELQQPLIAQSDADENESFNVADRHVLPPGYAEESFGRGFVGQEREWAGISNLDSFFQKVYEYFYERGFWRMLSSRIANLLMLGFTVLFSTFLLLFVDWKGILKCNSQEACEHIVGIRKGVLSSPSFAEVLVLMYFSVFSVYWFWHLLILAYSLRDGIEMRRFYNLKLHISEDDIQTIEWCEVVRRIEELQKTFKISIVKDHNALDIANRILRKDNFLIAMINRNVLDLGLPSLRRIGIGPIFSKSLEWNIRICILNSMFDEEFTIRKQFIERPDELRTHFQRAAIINFLLSPFVLIFMMIFFFLKNAEELHSRRSVMGPRQWTPLAEWRFREFNELPHVYRSRINLSHSPALLYIAQFPPSIASIAAKLVAYIAGAIVAVLLVITLFFSSIVLDIQILNHSLFWHLAFFSGVLAISRSLISSASPGGNFEALLDDVFHHTHYMPAGWRGNAHSSGVRQQFSAIYRAKLLVFVQELCGVLITPFVLSLSLPRCAERITTFLRERTIRVPGVGDVCAYAQYDFSASTSLADAKMEKSFLSFSLSHPHWRPDASGVHMLRLLARGGEPDRQQQQQQQQQQEQQQEREEEEEEMEEMSDSNAFLAMNVSQIMRTGMGHRERANEEHVQSSQEPAAAELQNMYDAMLDSIHTIYERNL